MLNRINQKYAEVNEKLKAVLNNTKLVYAGVIGILGKDTGKYGLWGLTNCGKLNINVFLIN
jgi:hypothetical protein